MSGSQVIELVSNDRVVLNLELMAILEHQHSRWLIRHGSWCRLGSLFSWLTLAFIAPASVIITGGVAAGPAGTTAVENRRPTTVVFLRYLGTATL